MGRRKGGKGKKRKVAVSQPEENPQQEQPTPPENPQQEQPTPTENQREEHPDPTENLVQEEQPLEEPSKPVEEAGTGRNEEEHVVEYELSKDPVTEPKRKRQRGPTKMKDIAKDPNSKVRVDFTTMGEPCGPGSVTLSSYLGPLVREHVPYNVKSWPKITEDMKTVLWKSIQARFELTEEYQKVAVFKQMGCLWRASKSRVVSAINNAKNNQERMNMRPKNIQPEDWRRFVKLKTSPEFKELSESYKQRRSKQIPHTCSRKGMVRLSEDMKNESSDQSGVSRLKVWVKSRTRKDGTPVNTNAAEKIKIADDIVNSGTPSCATNEGQDTLSQLLGPENHGRMRAMGRHMTKTKLACFQIKNKCMAEMEESQSKLQQKVHELQDVIAKMKYQRQEPEVGENSAARSVNKRLQPKCVLIDWASGDMDVAEGRIISSDPDELVNDSRLGPMDVKVLVNNAIVPETFLWRPASKMHTIGEAVGNMIAWPASKCVNLEKDLQPEDIAPLGPPTNSVNKCKLLNLSPEDEVVAEGRWMTQDPKALVNGLPIGPKAVKVFVDVLHEPETFLWRPTMEMSNLQDCLKAFVVWPVTRVIFEDNTDATATMSRSNGEKSPATSDQTAGRKSPANISMSTGEKATATSPSSPCRETETQPPSQPTLRRSQRNGAGDINVNQKCMLMDISGDNRVVAVGRVHSTDPNQVVHHVPLGSEGIRVWVDKVKVDDAAVWRVSDEIEYMRDGLGSSIAWPIDKVVIA